MNRLGNKMRKRLETSTLNIARDLFAGSGDSGPTHEMAKSSCAMRDVDRSSIKKYGAFVVNLHCLAYLDIACQAANDCSSGSHRLVP